MTKTRPERIVATVGLARKTASKIAAISPMVLKILACRVFNFSSLFSYYSLARSMFRRKSGYGECSPAVITALGFQNLVCRKKNYRGGSKAAFKKPY
jgi:hypothetical protein